MKIRKVKWKDHPILGDLFLDFTNSNGNSFDNIVFAGENGTGKTTLLESLSTFLNIGSFEYFEYIEYIVDSQILKVVPLSDYKYVNLGLHKRIMPDGEEVDINTNKNNDRYKIDTDRLDLRHYGCIFSKARADYKTEKITATTTKEIDADKYDDDSEDDFTSLKQLIVDIDHEDKDTYAQTNKSKGNSPMSWDDFYLTSKMYRFSSSFDSFFEKIKFKKIDNINSEKSIFFTKNNKDISIDLLSTGEKQIVFRGIYLLKNVGNLNGAVCMIDEPELSMHPKWQQKIFSYYKDLFKDIDSNKQKAQLLFSTHSTDVLKNALQDKSNTLVIVLTEDNGVISQKTIDVPSVLPTITSAETNYLSFDVVSNDYHIELYGYLQNKENKSKVKDCDDFIKNHVEYDHSIHYKLQSHPNGKTTYNTLPTYIRNEIDHPPANGVTFTDEELRISIELLIKLCQ